MKRTAAILVAVCLLAAPLLLSAQEHNNEMAFTLGAEFVPDHQTVATGATLDFSRSVVFGASYGRRLAGSSAAAFFLEFPFTAAPSHRIRSADPAVIGSLATLFVTPSLQVKLAPRAAVTPWFSGGFGWAFLEGDELLPGGAPNLERRRHTGAAQFGAGVDIRTPIRVLAPISLRAEVRDFYSLNTLNHGVPVRSGRQHHVAVAGGFLLRF
jgi:hypothetical protein